MPTISSSRGGDAERILASRARVTPELWQTISLNQRGKFRIAFCLSGTIALNVELA
jgi:hypothetical protein